MGITDGWELVVYTRYAYIQARGSWAVGLIPEAMVAAGSLVLAGMHADHGGISRAAEGSSLERAVAFGGMQASRWLALHEQGGRLTMTGGRVLRCLLVLLFCGLAASVSLWAAAPVITGVSIPNATMAINDVVVATISVQSDSATTFVLSAGNVGGYTLGGLSKIDSTTYTATFTIAEGGADYAAGIDIPVSATLTDGFTPDTWSTPISQANDLLDANRPSVTNVVADTSPVYDGDLTQGVTVTFSEAMATGAAPTIVFSAGTWTPGAAGLWSAGNTVWTRTYTLTDANVTVANVTVDVTGAQDAAGNAQQDYAPQAEFDIDTQNPTVVIAANDVAIYDGDVGVDHFTVTATYSEAMNPAVVPTLTFTPNPTTTFTNPSGAWSGGNTVYTWTYDVADGGVTVADVDLTVSSGAGRRGEHPSLEHERGLR